MVRTALLDALRNPAFYPDPTQHVEVRETHASVVFLTDHYAYKIKKPVNLGFLDYSTLARRHFFCTQELRLNRRLCPDVYLDVMALRREPHGYSFSGHGPVVEYALKMRRLPDTSTLAALLRHDTVAPQTIQALAQRLAAFHAASPPPPPVQQYGTLTQVQADWQENFAQTASCIGITLSQQDYDQIHHAVTTFTAQHADWFAQRVHEGRIRDCHGDLRAEHVYVIDGQIHILDCIEFAPRFRFIDVASEVAFLAMDLDRLRFPRAARQFVQAYVASSADVTLYRLLDFYRCYRAYVRGKVISILLQEAPPGQECPQGQHDAADAFQLAARYAMRCVQPLLILTTGLIGSGKSTLAAGVAAALDAHVFSADRVRKERAGLTPETPQRVAYGTGLYSAATTQQTYDALADLARQSLTRGESVMLDASFAKRAERVRMTALARALGAECYLLECLAPEQAIRKRLEQRQRAAMSISDGRWDIFTQFQHSYEPVQEDEPAWHVRLDTTQDMAQCVQQALGAIEEGRGGIQGRKVERCIA